MRSLFSRLALWAFATSIFCIIGFHFTENLRSFSQSRADFLSKFLEFQVVEARRAYLQDGKPGLRSFLLHLQGHFPGTYALLDEHGRDVLTGEDRHDDVLNARLPRVWRGGKDKVEIVWPDGDSKYYLTAEAVFPNGPPQPVPFYFWLLVAGLGFCCIPALQLASPLRGLSHAVEKFGVGDLGMRVNITGQDELGKLGRAFNIMADRIQLLLTAERRLLLDVSHELRSPLARLKFAVQLARTSPDRQKSLDRIERDIDRLSVLVSELLKVTRAESDPAGRLQSRIDLNLLLHEAVDAGVVEAQAHGCSIYLNSTDAMVVVGDRELLYRAVENVLRNAIRFAPDATSVDIQLSRRMASAAISIRDRGPGVPDESVQSLFKPFFRVEADRTRMQGGGFGLGLSIAERAVAVHGGSIQARNASPGLEVEIVLPLASESPLDSSANGGTAILVAAHQSFR